MTTFAKAAHQVLPAMIKAATTKLALHTQQITTLQSQSAAAQALVPGDWEAITLEAGWSNVSGAIPAQARLLTTTTVQIIANIEGGTTSNGTVIGTLTAGFYNTVHSHTFSVTAVAGAAAVSNPVSRGSLSSTSVTAGSLSDGSLTTSVHTTGASINNVGGTLNNNEVHTNSSLGTAPGSYTPSYIQAIANRINSNGLFVSLSGNLQLDEPGVTVNALSGSLNNKAVGAQNLADGSLNNDQTTAINYNGPACTLGTDGTLTIYNVNSNVNQVSFHEASLPLFTV
jgi:hypothetical protein